MRTAFNPSAAEVSKLPASPDTVEPRTAGDRRLLWELAVGYGFLLLALWSEGDLRWAWAVALILWILGVTMYHRPSLRQLGVGATGFLASLWIVGAAVAAGAAMLFGAHLAGTLHPYVLRRTLIAAASGYLIWTFQQQFMLQSFFFLRLERLLGSRKAVWAAAALFALAHAPNPVLVPATLAAGLVLCELFRRHRNIYTLAIAQAILGMCLAAAVPDAWHHHMRVGIGYLSWIPR
ncbi:MAG: type II CAAX prenyl endopeptidase Rce1 family protein [Terriglobales bacterium]